MCGNAFRCAVLHAFWIFMPLVQNWTVCFKVTLNAILSTEMQNKFVHLPKDNLSTGTKSSCTALVLWKVFLLDFKPINWLKNRWSTAGLVKITRFRTTLFLCYSGSRNWIQQVEKIQSLCNSPMLKATYKSVFSFFMCTVSFSAGLMYS